MGWTHWGLVALLGLFIVFLSITCKDRRIFKGGLNATSFGAGVGLLGAAAFCTGLGFCIPTDVGEVSVSVTNHSQGFEHYLMVLGGAAMAIGLMWFFLSFAW